MNAWLPAFLVLPGVACVWSVLYLLLARFSVKRWWGENPDALSSDAPQRILRLPPVTLLRPIKAGVPALREKLEDLARAMHPGDQLVLGVDPGSAEESTADQLRVDFADREILVVRCRRGAALNPKLSKLIQMQRVATAEHCILSDCEIVIERAWLDALRAEWISSKADVLTAGYRVVGARTWPQRLDAAAVLSALWPGLALIRQCGTPRFTLGACTAFRRTDLQEIGGWQALDDVLAEDHRLGGALAASGRRICLSRQIATLECDPLSWQDYWRHQRRVAITYRVCQPLGFAGMLLTHGVSASVLLLILVPSRWPHHAWLIAAAIILQGIRGLLLRGLARDLRFPIPALGPVLLIAGLAETLCWILSWFSRRVWWSGAWREVCREGRIIGVDPEKEPAISAEAQGAPAIQP